MGKRHNDYMACCPHLMFWQSCSSQGRLLFQIFSTPKNFPLTSFSSSQPLFQVNMSTSFILGGTCVRWLQGGDTCNSRCKSARFPSECRRPGTLHLSKSEQNMLPSAISHTLSLSDNYPSPVPVRKLHEDKQYFGIFLDIPNCAWA